MTEQAQKKSWKIEYPDDCVRYIEAFRRYYWDHEGACERLHEFFREKGDVYDLCELGSGAATNLMYFAQAGYRCVGMDSNKESINLSRERVREQGLEIDFQLASFMEAMPVGSYDAVLSMFVPISLDDMTNLAVKAASAIRPNGYFACMLLGVLPEYRHRPKESTQNMEFLEFEDDLAVRFNFFEKNGNQVDYQGVYFIGNEFGARMVRDKDTYDLIDYDQKLQLPSDLYRHVTRIPIFGRPNQAPPMTYEVIDVYQRL